MTLPADKYLIEALGATNYEPWFLDRVKEQRGKWPLTIAHARALERIDELEARLEVVPSWGVDGDGISCRNDTIRLLEEKAARYKSERDYGHKRIAKLEKRDGSMMTIIGQLQETVKIIRRERDEDLAKLAKYEPPVEGVPAPVDPDLVLAREVAAEYCDCRGWHSLAADIRAGNDDKKSAVQCALAGIKAG